MIKTLIIDDEQHAIDAIVNHLNSYKDYAICGKAKTVEEAIELTHKHQPDLVFLDIVLGNKTGFDYLNALLPNIHFTIVFTTAYNKYAVKAFEYSALHYLLKPIDHNRFKEALTRVYTVIDTQEKLERLKSCEYNMKQVNKYKRIHIPTSEKDYKLSSKNILFLKADSNYTHFHLVDNTKITVAKTLKYFTEILEGSHFFKVHKSYLVNLEQIKDYAKKTGVLTMTDETKIMVAVRRQATFVKLFFSK